MPAAQAAEPPATAIPTRRASRVLTGVPVVRGAATSVRAGAGVVLRDIGFSVSGCRGALCTAWPEPSGDGVPGSQGQAPSIRSREMSRGTRDSCLVPSGTPAGEDPRVQAQLPVTGPDTPEPEAAVAAEPCPPPRGNSSRRLGQCWPSACWPPRRPAILDAVTTDAARAAADATVGWIIGLPGLALAVPGAVLLHRAPRNAVSWVLAMTGLLWALDGLAQSWLVYAVQSDPPLPGAEPRVLVRAAVRRLAAARPAAPAAALPRRPAALAGRWRPAAIVSLVSTALLPALLSVVPSEIAIARAGEPLPAVFERDRPRPDQHSAARARWPCRCCRWRSRSRCSASCVPVASVVARLRRADRRGPPPDAVAGLGGARRRPGHAGRPGSVPGDATSLGLSIAVALTGVAVALGILRPRAVDIDRLLGGTLVYGALAVGVVLLDLAVLAGAGALLGDRLGERDVHPARPCCVVALVYVPLRAPLWRLVRRWLLGEREDPYRVVSGAGRAARALATARTSSSWRSRPPSPRRSGPPTCASRSSGPTAARCPPSTVGGPRGCRRSASTTTASRSAGWCCPAGRPGDAVATRPGAAGGPGPAGGDRGALDDAGPRAAGEPGAAGAGPGGGPARIRRDLHDGLGPVLGGVAMRLDAAGNAVEADPESARRLIRQSRTEIREALDDVRRLVHDLRPPALDDLGLLAAIRQQAERASSELRVDVDADGLGGLPAAVEVAAYRIVSESLANVVRHAGRSRCVIGLDAADELEIVVRDDGRGIAEDVVAGVGLLSLRERAEELGGQTEVTCPESGGTQVRAWLPYGGGTPTERSTGR